jgi:hypothetical protein
MKLQIKDWVIVALVILVVALGFAGYIFHQDIQGLRTSDNNIVSNDFQMQLQVNKLKSCIDQNIRPCNIVPVSQ